MTTRRRRSWVVEDTWSCSSCATLNRGRDMKCSSCGNPKDGSEKYKTGTSKVTDPKLLTEAKAGPNWSCAYCSWDNRDLLRACAHCGASRNSTSRDHLVSVNTDLPSSAPSGASSIPLTWQHGSSEPEMDVVQRFKPSRRVWLWLGLGAVALAFVSLCVWFFLPHEHDARVVSLHWEYVRTLQQRYVRHDTGWGHPPESFNVSCETRQHGTERCHPHNCRPHQVSYNCRPHDCSCHTSCRSSGNGYSQCHEICSTCYDTCSRTEYDTCWDQCPVYDDWCSYDYYEWSTLDTETTSGSDHNVRWGSRFTADESIPQRILRTEHYTVLFGYEEDQWTYTASSLTDFLRFNSGSSWDVETNYAGQIWPLHSLSP